MAAVRDDLDAVADSTKTAGEFCEAVVTLINTSSLPREVYRAALRDIAAGLRTDLPEIVTPESEVITNG